MSPSEGRTTLLEVKGLEVTIAQDRRAGLPILEGVDLTLRAGERLALVGESGSGKSVTAAALMGLLDAPLASTAEQMSLDGRDLLSLRPSEWRDVRGRLIGLVQQDPLTALSPVYTIGAQVAETLRRHENFTRRGAAGEAVSRLNEVGIPDAERRAHDYPHQLSGGLRQRAAIAVAIACRPKLLIADEPTTALDVTVQAQVISLLRRLSIDGGAGIVLITHDLGLLPGFADSVAVMYAGRIVEHGPCNLVLRCPTHPYTHALLQAQPGRRADEPRRRLQTIEGTPPQPGQRPQGCAFAPRCPMAVDVCHFTVPPVRQVNDRAVACHRAEEVSGPEARP